MTDLVVEEVVARSHMDEATNRSNLAFHRRVLGALRRRDSAAAARLMLAHVADVQRRLAKLMPRTR